MAEFSSVASGCVAHTLSTGVIADKTPYDTVGCPPGTFLSLFALSLSCGDITCPPPPA
ncbi:hypothetical protein YERSI8AC_150040 [Enterobacterales bacterium 8AC]|nr:hypothetical protein YERSI8AC_150040 [Enterobacterales bacterium 8AC]